MLSFRRSLIAALHDSCMALFSFVIALYLRLGEDMLAHTESYLPWGSAVFVLIFAATAIFFGLPRTVWRYVSMREFFTILRVVFISIALFYLMMFMVNRLEGIPRSVPFIHAMVLGGLLAGSRIAYRALRDRSGIWNTLPSQPRIPVLLIGYKNNAEQFIRDSAGRSEALYEIVAVVDADKAQHGRVIHGVPIMGGLDTIPNTLKKLTAKGQRPQRMIVSAEYLDTHTVSHLLELCDEEGLSLARLPRLTDFQEGDTSQVTLKPVAIEDILGRPQNTLDRKAMRSMIEGKVVLVTGAGGTIGGELSRQVASFRPKKLVLLDISEYHLYEIDREIMEMAPEMSRVPVIGDVRDAAAIANCFEQHQPQLVFHAAAIKHVPLAESNVEETILTNVFGSRNVADAAQKYKAETLLLISTDKAVNPTNVMGACKRLAEHYCQYVSEKQANQHTRYVTVRFGNVLGSTGSVVPLFQKQLEAGGPLTVTHPKMERYFMTVREAVELVIQAAVLRQDMPVQEGSIFVLDMGKPVKISELAMQMIRLAGLKPGEDIAIEYVGLRPGEKLYEELFHASENLKKTSHESILLAAARPPEERMLEKDLQSLYDACASRDAKIARNLLGQLVPEFQEAPKTEAA